ncbi:MAG TPA: hypothetical protein VHD62_01085 [Opitutaceae bacterium]|nr:hypothetical protein [Opitutaceae bacterium]
MNPPRFFPRSAISRVAVLGLAGLLVFAPEAFAQGKKKNPVSKLFVADVNGEAVIDTGDSIQDLSQHAVHTAQGAVIETKKPENPNDRSKYYSTMVYSNGTGSFFDADTQVEVKQFSQEPFVPNRTDLEVEPSISQTQAFVARGAVGLCVSKLVAGSTMNYQTPQASVNIRGQKVVIEANKNVTKISMLEGDSTVRAGAMDMGGHVLHAGEQAIISQAAIGQPNQIQIAKIPDSDMSSLDDKVAMACLAKKTVYFEVRDKKAESNGGAAEGAGESNSGGGTRVSAFDGDSGKGSDSSQQEIVPVVVVPTNLPTDYTMSAARAQTPPTGG